MATPLCHGVVLSASGHMVMLTGTSRLDNATIERKELEKLLRAAGARVIPSGTQNRSVTLLVQGSLPKTRVTDPVHVRSKKAVFVDSERRRGRHVCIVDDAGITNLLTQERTATCLDSRVKADGGVELATPPAALLGAPFSPRDASALSAARVLVDMEQLGERTLAHERLLQALGGCLPGSARLQQPGWDMPRFDAGWVDPQDDEHLYIVEAKTLPESSADPQLRLGLGQVLDYAQAVRETLTGTRVTPVLLVDRAPDGRWERVMASVGAVIIYPEGPGLVGLRGVPSLQP